jgi:uncharacterized membrane protein
VLHVIKDVLLVLLGGCTRKFLAKSLLLNLVDLTCALSLCRGASIDTLIVAFGEERLTVPVGRVLALNWTESHVGVVLLLVVMNGSQFSWIDEVVVRSRKVQVALCRDRLTVELTVLKNGWSVVETE